MKSLSASPYASRAEIMAEFQGDEAVLAHELLGLRQAPGAALQTRIASLAKATSPRSTATWPPWGRWRPHQRWAAGALTLALMLALALAVAGPQRVLAQVQRLLGYLPGYGFVDPDQTRVLTAPVTVERDGVSVTVTQLIAGTDKTQVTFVGEGLNELPSDPNATRVEIVLVLPNGGVLTPDETRLEHGSARLAFPPIPAEVEQVTLRIARLPLVRPGAAPENWSLALSLRPAAGDFPAAELAAPYVPEGAHSTVMGITLDVVEVVEGTEQTAVTIRMSAAAGTGIDQVMAPDPWGIRLSDDSGHAYWVQPDPGLGSGGSVVVQQVVIAQPGAPPAPAVWEQTYAFGPLSPSTGHASLRLDEIAVRLDADESFRLDLGASPHIGQHWLLDEILDVYGAALHFTGATLVEFAQLNASGQPQQYYQLKFDVAVTDAPDLALQRLNLWSAEQGLFGDGHWTPEGWEVFLAFEKLPHGRVTVSLRGAYADLRGPWVVQWDRPGEHPEQRPRSLHPQAADTHHGLTLAVAEVVASDRLTHVQLAAEGLPAGGRVTEIRPTTGLLGTVSLGLQDQWGQAIPTSQDVRWQPPGTEWAYDPLALTFEPLPPLAQSLTLVVPEVIVQFPDDGSLSVDVPPAEALTFTQHEAEYEVVTSGGDGSGPAYHPLVERSQTWPVDLQMKIAGYTVHYTQAFIEREAGNGWRRDTLVLTGAAPGPDPNGWRLAALQGARTQRPDGSVVTAAESPGGANAAGLAYGWVSPPAPGVAPVAMLRLEVNDPHTSELLSGRYELAFDAVQVAVSGPWRLGWSMVLAAP
ncbi:MAG: hypothetical protein IT318_26480 [Anaerolineales bacterium]|nr:hypothetical protein [Anaerolineales bacterium]